MSDDGMKIVGSVRDDKLYRSLDGGAVWNIINNDVKKWCGIFTLDFEVIYASVSDGGNIWKTDNGGGNWYEITNIGSSGYYCGIVTSNDYSQIMVANKGGHIKKSSDGGANWYDVTQAPSDDWRDLCGNSNSHLKQVIAIRSNGFMMKTIDYGNSWSSLPNIGEVDFKGLTCSPDLTKIAVVIKDQLIQVSYDSGITWIQLTAGGSLNWHGITSTPDFSLITASVDGGLVHHSIYDGLIDSSTTFETVATAVVQLAISRGGTSISDCPTNSLTKTGVSACVFCNAGEKIVENEEGIKACIPCGNNTYSPSYANGTCISVPVGKYSTKMIPQDSPVGFDIRAATLSADGTKILAALAGTQYLYFSQYAGSNWELYPLPPMIIQDFYTTDMITIIATEEKKPWIHKTSDSGKTWQTMYSIGSGDYIGLVASHDYSQIMVANKGGHIKKSSDGGANWYDVSQAPSDDWKDLCGNSDLSKVIAIRSNGTMMSTIDNGNSWSSLPYLGEVDFTSLTCSPDLTRIAVAIKNSYMHVSYDSGLTWIQLTSAGSKEWVRLTSTSDFKLFMAFSGKDRAATSIYDGPLDASTIWTTSNYDIEQLAIVGGTSFSDCPAGM